MIGPARAVGAFDDDPAPPDAHGVECVDDFVGPLDGPPRAGNEPDEAAPDAPGT